MRKINIIFGALATVVLLTSPSYRVNAADNCDFKSGLENLSSARNASMSNENQENILRELTARKNLINQTIDCSINEVLNIQSDVKLAETNYSDINDIQNKIISKLDEIIGYYQMQKTYVNDLGIEGSKNFAANLKSWRNSNYVPISEISDNFIIFSKNQYIMQTTRNRLDQITLTLKTLGLTDNQKISDGLNEARKNLNKANADNEQIKDAFRTMAWPNNISDFINSSLQHLKDAYQNFFDVSTNAQDIISGSK